MTVRDEEHTDWRRDRALFTNSTMLMKNQQCVRHRSRALGLENKTNIPSLTFSAGQERNQFSSLTQSCLILCDPMDCSTPGFPVHHQHPELIQTHIHQVGDAIQPSHPVVPFSSCLRSFPASESFPMSQGSLHRVAKYWSFSFNISPSNEYSGLIFFRIDSFDLLAVQGKGKRV